MKMKMKSCEGVGDPASGEELVWRSVLLLVPESIDVQYFAVNKLVVGYGCSRCASSEISEDQRLD